MTFGGFQVFKTDLRLITKPGNELITAQHEGYFIICTMLEAHQILSSELEIAVGHWPFSNQLSPFGRANPSC